MKKSKANDRSQIINQSNLINNNKSNINHSNINQSNINESKINASKINASSYQRNTNNMIDPHANESKVSSHLDNKKV